MAVSVESVANKVVLPGDVLLELNPSELASKVIIGPGLRRDSEKIVAVKSGIVRVKESRYLFVDNRQKRYVPVRGENVIGIVTKRSAEDVTVDIGSSEPAYLQLLAFEGATKRNKPMIKVGDLVYAKILVSCKDMEPELVCVDSYGKSSGLGVLPEGGFLFTVSLQYARRLLSPKCPIIKRLGDRIRFEVTVGMNGRVWVKTVALEKTLLVVQALTVLEYANEEEVHQMCSNMFDASASSG